MFSYLSHTYLVSHALHATSPKNTHLHATPWCCRHHHHHTVLTIRVGKALFSVQIPSPPSSQPPEKTNPTCGQRGWEKRNGKPKPSQTALLPSPQPGNGAARREGGEGGGQWVQMG